MNQIAALIRVFSYLSILTVGGGMAAFPEMKVLTVDVHKWLTFPQLIHIYSVGQMAPGPNMMMIVVIGQWAGGLLGAVVPSWHSSGPTAVLAYAVAKGWRKLKLAVEKVDPARARAGLHRLAPRRMLHHGQGCGHRTRDGSNCCGDADDTSAVQDQPGAAGGRRRSCGTAFLHAEVGLRVELLSEDMSPLKGRGRS